MPRANFIVIFLILGPLARGAGESRFSLTIDNIMRGPNLVGTEPADVRWSGDSSKIYFQWKKYSDPASAPLDTYVVDRTGGEPRKLSEDEARLAPPTAADLSGDRSLSVYAEEGDIVVFDNAGGKRRQVTKTAAAETNPHFTRDGKHIAFVRDGNLYLMSLDNGGLEQLTDIRPAGADAGGGRGGRGPAAAAGETPKGTDAQEYLKKE